MKPSTKVAHTPGPREIDPKCQPFNTGFVIRSKPLFNMTICKLPVSGQFTNNEANAEFIVRACNSFEGLLEAAKKALEGLQEGIDRDDIAEVLAAAIVKTEER